MELTRSRERVHAARPSKGCLPELPDPELPDRELPAPELPDPELPDPELPDPEFFHQRRKTSERRSGDEVSGSLGWNSPRKTWKRRSKPSKSLEPKAASSMRQI